ncbi:hypothetical protein DYB37_002820 [Aphanomyces astaci]|uniref:Uncharacterized protein n=1 Tax=Aphanomyces astaci TaxID=112090 RepID=A0A3R7BNV4_APHAT|nr:hypothetical protein DYB35_002114 [Aphanomyces astaci]RHZ34472.1 hypothetical protein DYB37_002820 [Aphanomyces astaci]
METDLDDERFLPDAHAHVDVDLTLPDDTANVPPLKRINDGTERDAKRVKHGEPGAIGATISNKYCGSCTIALTSRRIDLNIMTDNDPRTHAVVRAVGYLTSILSDPPKFKLVGHVASLYLHQLAAYTAVDFLGWNPTTESIDKVKFPALCGGCGLRPARLHLPQCCNRPVTVPSTFERFRAAIVVAAHAEQVGVSIGCTFLDVFAQWGRLRPAYIKHPTTAYDQAVLTDQWKMICTVLDVLSVHGTRLLPPQLLELELTVLSNIDQLQRWLTLGNVDLFGMALYSLTLFPYTGSVVDVCQDVLVETQHPTLGYWGLHDDVIPFLDLLRFKTTGQVGTSDESNNPLLAAVQQYLSTRAVGKQSEQTPVPVCQGGSFGWKRYTRECVRHVAPVVSHAALTMNDLSIFEGLKFDNGEVFDLSQATGTTLDDAIDVEEVDDDDDDEDQVEQDAIGQEDLEEDWQVNS